MDRLADAAWRSKAPPFDGRTLEAAELATTRLHAAVLRLVEVLGERFSDTRVHTAEDWLEHDAWISEPAPSSWGALAAAVATVEAFIEASPEDTWVRRAWLGDGAFYLRWHYYDEGDSPFAATPAAGGDLDLTADPATVDAAVRALEGLGIDAAAEEAHAFFQRRWNG